MSTPKIIVIYHRADFDGLFCREIARHFLADSAEYIGHDYGDPVPVVPADAVLYMMDISIPELMGHAGLIWIDHHKSAILAHPHTIAGYRLDGVAACRLAWQWFGLRGQTEGLGLPSKQAFLDRAVAEPLAVRLAGEYDIWDKRDPMVDPFQSGLRSGPLNYPLLLSCTVEARVEVLRLAKIGGFILYARREGLTHLLAEGAFNLRFEGLHFLACNALGLSSDAYKDAVRPEHDACLSFGFSGKKGRWKISLRGVAHKPDLDLSVVAVKWGGGGHKQACGFECDVLPFAIKTALDGYPIRCKADEYVIRAESLRIGDRFAFRNEDLAGQGLTYYRCTAPLFAEGERIDSKVTLTADTFVVRFP